MSSNNPTMEWDRINLVPPLAKTIDHKDQISVPSTEGMPPLSDITKHKGKRRTRTGSLTAHYTVAECRERDNSVPKMPPLTRIRRPPITGGSWDDNSVGHGSVVSRIRRERNRAILRTQSSVTNPLSYHSIDSHANVTSTLNLINTTALSPLPSDRLYDRSDWLNNFWMSNPHQPSAAAKSSAGSMCNIPASGYHNNLNKQHWDTLSIPELHSTKSCDKSCHKSHHRHSYSSGYANASYLHSSPTSGCASIASSDLDSADFMYFNINDDSSYFDGDSLFADSLGIIGDNETAFSTNILSLLEEGSISCRTPFPASDWPDSISELDFDCSEGKPEDLQNCDALSDIGPSCSSPPQRRRMAKRQSVTHQKLNGFEANDSDNDEPSVKEVNHNEYEADDDADSSTEMQDPLTPTESSPSINSSTTLLSHPMTEMTWLSLTNDEKQEYLTKLVATINQTLSHEEKVDTLKLLSPTAAQKLPYVTSILPKDIDFTRLQIAVNYLQTHRQGLDSDWVLIKTPEQKNGTVKLIKQKKIKKYGPEIHQFTNHGTTLQRKMECDYSAENSNESAMALTNCCSSKSRDVTKVKPPKCKDLPKKMDCDYLTQNNHDSTMISSKCSASKYSSHAESKSSTCEVVKVKTSKCKDLPKNFIDMVKCLDDNVRTRRHLRKSMLDEPSLKTRNRPVSRHETSSIKSADTQHADSCSDPSCKGCSAGLRRSNSEGNIAGSIGAKSQKEHRRQQRQARRWSEWNKTRQRKENRQLKKEHRSGLFLKEHKVMLTADSEDDEEVEVS